MESQYNILVDLVGGILVGSIFIFEHKQPQRGDPIHNRLLHILMVCCILVFLSDIPGLLLDGCQFAGNHVLLWFVDSVYWVFQILFCWLWLTFADYWVREEGESLKKRSLLYSGPMLLELLLLAVNPITNWIFEIDSQNVYIRGNFYLLNMLIYGFYIVATLKITWCEARKSEDYQQRQRGIALAVYMFLPIIGVFMDIFIYGISWVWPMVALSLLMVYLHMQQQATIAEQIAAAKLKEEVTDSRIAIMLSQIQPHFLFNALNTVDALCDRDTKAAQKAIRSFAKYLRGNLDALTRKAPVRFQEELSHLEQYLTLETLRFDNLQIEYHLEVTDFMLPVLTLQPLVENAVKHGILKREQGGTVIISTWEQEDSIIISVKDDGVGFDPTEVFSEKSTHVGLNNVQQRLDRFCRGIMIIKSIPRKGTEVICKIPKKEDRNESNYSG